MFAKKKLSLSGTVKYRGVKLKRDILYNTWMSRLLKKRADGKSLVESIGTLEMEIVCNVRTKICRLL